MNNTKKYKLKPGRHQFVPGSHAVHSNDNLSDEEAEWYLEKYPHIIQLFEKNAEYNQEDEACQVSETETPQSLNSIGEIEN